MVRKVWVVMAAGLLGSILWTPSGVGAQESNSATSSPGEKGPTALQEKRQGKQTPTLSLGEVVVTATKIETPFEQIPAAVTVITREEIQRQQVTDALEVLRDVPGFTIVQTGSRGGTTSLFTRGGNSNFNQVLIDGVKANATGGFFDFSDLTTDDIDRIEIIRGPQSALYGSDAISSVVQFFTQRGSGPPQASLRFGGGSFGTFEEHGRVAGGTQTYGYSIALGRIDSEGILPINNSYGNTTLASRFDLTPLPQLTVTTTVRYSDGRFRFPTGSAGDRFDPRDPHQFQDRRRLIVGPRLVYTPVPWWEQTLQLGLYREERTFRDRFDPGIDFGGFLSQSKERRLSADYTSNFFLPPVLNLVPTLTLGGYFEDEHLDQASRFQPGGTPTLPTRIIPSRNMQAFYTQGLVQWNEQLFLVSGFRLDNSSTFGTDLNPRFSAAYILPWTKTKIRGGYATGIKAPSFIENFGTGNPSVIGNRKLQPEKSESWEVGLDQPVAIATREMLLSLTYFSADYNNLIAFVFGATPSFLNIQRVRSRGLEMGLRADLGAGFSFLGSYTHLDTTVLDPGPTGGTLFVKGKSLLRRPDHSGAFTFNYARQRLNANFNVTIKGDSIDRDFHASPSGKRVTLGGYTKADLALSYRLWENRWGFHSFEIMGRAQNLFDENYEEVFGFSTAGANFLLGFRAEF